ncbi:ABC transporter permease [Streptomyces sp. NPDC059650]|uniref:ABC transporter permease n=1 Tax=Streptomyces sp. NPDC059650 TaxID=3346896 RepID=UPI0036853A92
MFRTAWRTVCAHKSRMAMTVLAIMVGVAFVTGTLVFTATVSDSLTGAYRQSFAHTDVVIRPDDTAAASGEGPAALSAADLGRVESLPESGEVIAVASGYTALGCPDGRSADRGGPTRGGNYAAAGTSGTDPRYTFTRGRPPANDGQIAVDADSAARCDYRVGDTARISVDGPGLTARISGIFTTRAEPAVAAGGSLVLFDTATAQRHFTGPGRYSEFQVKAAPGADAEQLAQATQKAVAGAVTLEASILAHDQKLAAEASVNGLRSTLLSFAAMTLFVSCFLISNTFGMLVAQRTREIGLLRAVGASRRQVTRRVLAEAFLIALVASLAGTAVGIGVAQVLGSFAGDLGKSGPLPSGGTLSLPPYALLVPLLSGVLTTLVAAWLPARRAARIAPLAALRVAHAPARPGTGQRRIIAGALLTAAGMGSVLAATTIDRAQDGAPVMALGAVLTAGGLITLMPTLVKPALALARPLLTRAGASTQLAQRNSARNPRRTAAAAASLVIGVSLVSALTLIATGMLAAATTQGAHVLKADYVVSMRDLSPLSPAVEKRLAANPTVTSAAAVRETQLTINDTTQYASALPAAAVRDMLRLRVTSGSDDTFGAHRVLVPAGDARAYGWSPGTRLPATLPGGEHIQLTVTGVYEPNTLLDGILIDTATLPPAATDTADKILLSTHEEPSPAMRRALAQALGDSPALTIDSSEDLAQAAARDTNRMLNLLYALLALSVTVAFLGIVNTLALSVAERQREIGMLRAIGLTRTGVRAMVRAEALMIAVFGGVIGTALGVFLGLAGGALIADDLPGYRHTVPAARLATLLVLTTAAGMLASLWPARRAARTPVLTAIGAE